MSSNETSQALAQGVVPALHMRQLSAFLAYRLMALLRDCRPISLLQRFIEPEEVAEMIAFVCSPVSSATNGASLRAGGGIVRSAV